jgi:hypothetical protein
MAVSSARNSSSWNDVSPFLNTIWILSVLFFVALAGYNFIPAEGEALESHLYFLGGFSICAVLLLETFGNLGVKLNFNKLVVDGSKLTLTVIGLAGILFISIRPFSYGAFLGAVSIWTLIVARFQMSRKAMAAFFLFLFVLWQFFVKLSWFDLFDKRLFRVPHTYITFALAFALAAWWIRDAGKAQKLPRTIEWSLHIFFSLLFLLCATRQGIDFHHWSFYLGPIQLLHEGHWLLWDIPSQYGFLNILLASLLPFESPLTSLYFLDTATLFIAAILSYRLLCMKSRNLSTMLFAGIIVFMSAFLFSGEIELLRGPTTFPSVGAFRFIWCYAVLFIATKSFNEKSPITRSTLIMGTVFWTIALFWSFESGVYTSCIWLPFLLITRWGSLEEKHLSYIHRASLVFRDLIVSTLMPLFFAVAIWFFYNIRLGHGPDWYAYIEYALTYKNGFGGLPIKLSGSVWTLLFVLALITTMAAVAIKRKSYSEIAFALSILAFVWVTGSYFMLRSHESVLSNLLPVTVFALSAALILANRFADENSGLLTWKITLQSVFSAIFIIGLTTTLGNPKGFYDLKENILKPRTADALHQQMVTFPAEQTEIFRNAGIHAEDSIVFLGSTLFPAWSQEKYFFKLWLPLAPSEEFGILSEKRQHIYLQRFLEANSSPSAWIVTNNLSAFNRTLSTELEKYYENPEYQEVRSINPRFKMHLFKYKRKETVDSAVELAR